jgi:hypothetical protein
LRPNWVASSAGRRTNGIRLDELELRYRARDACVVTRAATPRSCSSVNSVAMVCIAGIASGPGLSFGKIDPVA